MCERVETKEAIGREGERAQEQRDGGKQADNDLELNLKRGGV